MHIHVSMFFKYKIPISISLIALQIINTTMQYSTNIGLEKWTGKFKNSSI
jgi:hypothetical protein